MTYDPESGLHLPSPDDQREQRLQLLADLGLGAPSNRFDAFATELARAAGEPYAMVNLFTDEQVFVGLHCPEDGDLPAVGRTMPRDQGWCPEVVERGTALVLPDVYAHPRFAGNPVVDAIGIRTYAGAPLIHQPTGTVLGTVCVVGPTERPRTSAQARLALLRERRDTLMELIGQHTSHVLQ
ncbi:GAF domain-containing protein [Peterkaempfera griseoplana]|uniref:GAF domain-containing protein n=1 Tax=Peterkaempfera griseoplana TaxID=66896 RepID=UPI0006E301FC|nr:GAF domain-containing protein [Peterkaempfera griseoplana]